MESTVDENELNRYFRMYKTVIQMLHDRKYVLDEARQEIYDEDTTFDVFQTYYVDFEPKNINFVLEHIDSSVPRVSVRFDITENKITPKICQALYTEMKAENISHIIIIVKDGSISSGIARTIEKVRQETKMKIEYFEQKEVLINITKHDLVPKHEPLNEEEKRELLKRYNINESQLPKILKLDPVVRYFGVDPGVVMKITRRSETAGRYVTYRLVC